MNVLLTKDSFTNQQQYRVKLRKDHGEEEGEGASCIYTIANLPFQMKVGMVIATLKVPIS